MSKFHNTAKVIVATQNVGHKTADAVKKVPGKTGEAKVGFGRKLHAMKEDFKAALEEARVVEAEVIDSPVTTNSYGHGSAQQNAARHMFELTTGGK